MSITPVQLSRISTLQQSTSSLNSLNRTQASLLTIENELNTGKSLNSPSDNPTNSAIAQQLHKTLEYRQGYLANLQQGQAKLSQIDSTLGASGGIIDLLRQAQNTASANVGSDVSASNRSAAAVTIQSIYSSILTVSNQQFEGAYLFGGDSNTQPFSESAGGVQYKGSNNPLENVFDVGTTLATGVKPSDVFGTSSAPSGNGADITPAVTSNTRVGDLRGASGNGVKLGSITLGDGTTTATLDLSKADTVGDITTIINGAGLNVTAAIGASGLILTGGAGANISVSDVSGGTAAQDLGISTLVATPGPVIGAALSPKLTTLTALSDLNGGAGLDVTGGLLIKDGTANAVVDLSGATTVQDLLNKINSSGTGALARINSAGNGIEIVNSVQGTRLSIGENGGTVATTLGVRTYSPATQLSQLNGGKGIGTAGAGKPDIQITAHDGSTFSVDLSGAKSVQDVIDAINLASPGSVTASFATTGNGIVFNDSTAGSSNLQVEAVNNSTAAKDLGIAGTTSNATLTGSDANPAQSGGIFSALLQLQTALQNNDQAGITAASVAIQSSLDQVIKVDGQVGARVQEMDSHQSTLASQNVATQTLLSSLEDTNYTTAITQFQTLQNSLQASLQATAKVLNLSLLSFLQ
jgi:flagellar hook-associated protein 3 FlgL